MRRFASLLLAATVLALPSGAQAAALKGQVAGQPYLADAHRTAVPILLSKETARKAKLSSPVGIAVVPRRTALRAPGGSVLPGRLRLGDKFSATAPVSKEARKSTYPRLALRGMKVTKRSKQLSTTELEELLARTRKDVAKLSTTVANLAGATQRALGLLDGRVTALRTDVNALTSGLATVQSDLVALGASLQSKIDQVRTDLQPQITALLDQVNSLSSLLGSCAQPTSLVGRLCALEGAVSLLQPANLASLTDRVTQLSGALTTLVSSLTGLSLTGDLPTALSGPVLTALGQLTGLQGTVAGLQGTVSGLTGTVSGITTQLGAVDVTALSSTLGNLLTTLGTDPTGLSSSVLAGMQSTLGDLQADVSGLLTNLGTVDIATLAGDVSTIQSTLAGVCGALNGQTLPIVGTLPLIGSVAGLLSATLPDAC